MFTKIRIFVNRIMEMEVKQLGSLFRLLNILTMKCKYLIYVHHQRKLN